MIKELFLYFTTRVSPEAKKFGHLYEAIAIEEREKRCHRFWQSHREESKKTILRTVSTIQEKKSLLILGTGPLHEIPIEQLSAMFDTITLVDIVHLPKTKKKYQALKNITFIEHDITELELKIGKIKQAINIIPQQFLHDNYDLVISANILSQLAYHPREFLVKNAHPKLSEEKLDQFSNQISLDHFSYLKKFNCPVLLITDIETKFINKDEKIVEVQTPYLTMDFPSPYAVWDWNVAPIPEYSPEISLQMKVAGFILNR
jgi:hypothetical protein